MVQNHQASVTHHYNLEVQVLLMKLTNVRGHLWRRALSTWEKYRGE